MEADIAHIQMVWTFFHERLLILKNFENALTFSIGDGENVTTSDQVEGDFRNFQYLGNRFSIQKNNQVYRSMPFRIKSEGSCT